METNDMTTPSLQALHAIIEEFEHDVRADEMKGAGHPADAIICEHNLLLSREALHEAIATIYKQLQP
jgi:hypothetical protein